MKNTALIITICMIVLGIYDFYVVAFLGMDSTISRVVQEAGFRSPFFCLFLGFCLGHWFGYFKPRWKNAELLVKQMSERLVETDELGVRDGKFYWKGSGKCLDGQDVS